MPRWLYSLLLRCSLPFAMLAFVWRGWRHTEYQGSLRERLGLSLPARSDHPVWLHAASVGEVQALLPLMKALRAEQVPLLVTVGTPTGVRHARRLLEPDCAVHAAPWDLPGATARFFQAFRPRAGVLVEAELWPNQVAAARCAGVPLVLVSGRISGRSLRRHRLLAPGLMRSTVRAFARIGAQDEACRSRFVELGAAAERVTVTGNLKLDLALPEDLDARGRARRASIAPSRPVWVAGSTHEGEEQMLLDAQRLLAKAAQAAGLPVPMLVIAPRRPERFNAVARWLESAAVAAVRSSQDAIAYDVAEVVLVDQMGVLLEWYAAGDVAFVGGSLVPAGGHNVLEPAALGRFVLTGPCRMNAPGMVAMLREAGGLEVVRDAAGLAAALQPMLREPARAREAGERARCTVLGNQGAVARALAMVKPLLATAPA
jgi:3-deoxy-D-manno-octulosonic-acid transferase